MNGTSPVQPQDAAEAEVEAACRKTIVELSHHLDHREFARAAEMFTIDAQWHRHGEVLVGRKQIREVIEARPASQVERHVITTSLVTTEGDERSVVSYGLIFRAHAHDAARPLTTTAPSVGEFHDRLTLTDEGWRISSRSAVAVFAPQNP